MLKRTEVCTVFSKSKSYRKIVWARSLLAQVGNNGQLDIINITYPKEAVPGSVEAMIYLTGIIFV